MHLLTMHGSFIGVRDDVLFLFLTDLYVKCHSDFSRICRRFVYLSKNVRTCKETKNYIEVFATKKRAETLVNAKWQIIDFLRLTQKTVA